MFGVHASDERPVEEQECACAGPGHESTANQDGHGGRRATHGQSHDECRHRCHVGAERTVLIGVTAGQHDAHELAQQQCGERPAIEC